MNLHGARTQKPGEPAASLQGKRDQRSSPSRNLISLGGPLVSFGVPWHEGRMQSDPDPHLTIIRDEIIEALLPSVAFEGWTPEALRGAARLAGYESAMADAAFPDGIAGAIDHFSDMADRKMLAALESIPMETMRVRDRIRLAVATRLDLLVSHREAVRLSMARWALSPHGDGLRAIWRTADRIWIRAGDTATDYNRYTKRSLLAGVLISTTIVWVGESGTDSTRSKAFLDRRIENVMQLGKMIGRLKKRPVRPQEAAR